MSKPLHYFPLYYQRLLASTNGWTDEEIGCYIRLLIYQFDKGFVPGDEKSRKRISEKSVKNWSLLSQKFEQKPDGNLINTVMEEIRKDSLEKSLKNSANGALGGRGRKRTESERKANGYETLNPNDNPNERQPIANSQYKESSSSSVDIFELMRRSISREQFSDEYLVKQSHEFVKKFNGNIRNAQSLVNSWVSNMKPEYKEPDPYNLTQEQVKAKMRAAM